MGKIEQRQEQQAAARETEIRGFKRRTIVKGAAWSIPVIAAAVAVPAHASSQPNCTQVGSVWLAQATTANWATAAAEIVVPVPVGATRMHFVVVGGDGGYAAQDNGNAFGKGAYIEGDLAVAQGDLFYLQAGAGGEAGWLPGQGGGQGRGGKSLYGNGGNGGLASSSGSPLYGYGGGGASALLSAARLPVAVAGGGGGSNINSVPVGPDEALYSATLFQNQLATYGASSATGQGGPGNAGLPGVTAKTGHLGWMGLRDSASSAPTPSQIVLMSGGGIGGGASENAAGAGGTPVWVSGPDFANYWTRNGGPGSGHNGGNGVVNPTSSPSSTAASGGGGGGYAGGGGGASTFAQWFTPPYPYNGDYGITGGGGGGSSYVIPGVTNLTVQTDPRTVTTDSGEMGYVQVTFYTC